jgi:RNA polymerase sigma-70 factor (ECF subfamily)
LLAALCKGDDRAFDEIFRAHYASLTFTAFQLTGDAVTAKDITQDVFVKLWEHRARLGHVKELRTYLYTMVRNACINWRLRRQNSVTGEIQEEVLPLITDTPETAMIKAEVFREVHRVIALLPPRMQQVFRLYYLEGKTPAEISRLTHASVGTVKVQRKIALRLFRSQFIPD